MFYKVTDPNSARSQGHAKTRADLSQSTGDQRDRIMWNPGLDLETKKEYEWKKW